MKLKYLSLPFFALALSLSTMVALPQQAKAVSAADWRAGRIIDDAVFFNKDSMSVQQIQNFLNAKVPNCDRWNPTRFTYAGKPYGPPYTCLKEYQENPTTKENNIGRFNPDGSPYNVPGGWSAALIIKDAAEAYSINPQVLLVMLQKETAIVTDTWAAGWQYDRAMGYGCPDNGPNNTANCNAGYYGFYNQVGNAAWQLKRYTTNPNEYNFKAGVTRNILWQVGGVCGSSPVYLENAATAALYNYTPYQPNQAALNNLYGTGDGCSAYGNRNFWRLFSDWFGSTLSNDTLSAHPNGTLTSDGKYIYIVDQGTKRHISYSAFKAYNYEWNNVKKATIGDRSLIPGSPMWTVPSGTLFSMLDGKLYITLEVNGQLYKQWMSLKAFQDLGYNWQDIIETTSINEVPSLTLQGLYTQNAHPNNTLISLNSNVYLRENNVLRYVSPYVFESYGYKWNKVYKASDIDSSLPIQESLDYRTGSLIHLNNNLYIIDKAQGQVIKRPIGPWECVFIRFSYEKNNIIELPRGLLIPYANGTTISC